MSKPHSKALRKGRWSECGQYYFLTTTIAGRRKIFTEKNNAKIVLDAVRWLDSAGRFIVEAAVVMPDHLHLAGKLGLGTLAEVMHSLKSYTAQCLGRAGIDAPVWQDGYHDHGLRDDEDYRVRVSYMLENPLRAGLVRKVEDYPHLILPKWWDSRF